MNFDELIGLKPNLILAELIQLFLLGDDDKIYIDVGIGGELVLEHIRIIDNKLVPYYESKIEYLYDSCSSMMTVGLEL